MTERAANRFQGAVALVTGAARGIGRGIALKLAAEGASIVVNDLGNMELADRLVQEIHNLGREAFSWQADVSDRTAVVELMAATVERFGRLDLAVANAAHSVREGAIKAHWEGVRRTVEVTQFGTYHICQLAALQMAGQPLRGRCRGKIVMIGSIMQELPVPTSPSYSMAKAAINHFARTLAAELTTSRINVNVVNPGWIDTPGERAFASEAEIEAAGPRMPWGRLGIPEDIANAVAFLASDEADYITGTSLRVDGGYMVNLTLAPSP